MPCRTVPVEFFFAPDCPACARIRERLRQAAQAAGLQTHWRDTNVLDAIDRAVSLRILKTPAVVIGDDEVFCPAPSAENFVAALRATRSLAPIE